MKIRKLIPLSLVAFALLFTMCTKDESEDGPDYVGEWETDTFPFEVDGATVNAKMDFTIEEFSFEDEVKIVTGSLGIPVLGVKGTIEPKGANILKFAITDLGEAQPTGGYDYKNIETDAEMFQGIYQAMVASFLPQAFDAEYTIEGDRMDLVIPVASDTIVLYRK